MDRATITGQLTTAWAGRRLVYLPHTSSTQEEAKLLCSQDAPHGTLVVTDDQRAGRGRGTRSWLCPPGENLAMSLLLRPRLPREGNEPAQPLPLELAPLLTPVAGLAVAEGVAALLPETWRDRVFVKWPNDVGIAERKICGILTEAVTDAEGTLRACILGIGINVRQSAFPPELAEIAGSILTQTGTSISRSALVARILEAFERHYADFLSAGDLSPLLPDYQHRLINLGREVRVLDPAGAYTGRAIGVTARGALQVLVPGEQTPREISSGEVSVRGLYHYV